jgi:FKBP-type peptidyl-prolyl cis-trans isomerase FklB
MKVFKILFISLLSISTLQAQNSENPMDTVSYAVGVWLGNIVKQQGFDKVDTKTVSEALGQVLNGGDLAIDPNQAGEILKNYIESKKEREAAENVAAGKKYLEENAKKEGVSVTDSGLQYEILKEGTGPIPTAKDRVNVHYHGTLIDGTVFDSSVERGTPATFGVTQVIKGWVEALQMMPVGSKWRLTIPSEIAYGERGAGGAIGPGATLIFDVELLGIE